MSNLPDQPKKLALYEHELCGFCQQVRRTETRLTLPTEVTSRNILHDPEARQALIKGGGRAVVPCLRIETADGEVTWLYESADIIQYLKSLSAAA